MNDAFDEEMRAAVRSLPPAPTIKPSNGRHEPQPSGYDFEELGVRIAEGMQQAAAQQLVEVQNMLAQTQAFAEDMRNRIEGKANELADLNNRLRIFGAAVVAAHQAFCGEAESTEK